MIDKVDYITAKVGTYDCALLGTAGSPTAVALS
jgi:hypothetical protein